MPKDPFEQAAKREQMEEARRELMREEMLRSARRRWRGSGTGKALWAFGFPYLVWGLLRAANHDWSGSLGESLFEFFFRTGVWFAAYTGWIVFLLWVWPLARDDDD